MSAYKPPFTITAAILALFQDVSRELGRLEGQKLIRSSVILRRANQIKTIQASLAIEGNTLDLEQVTALLEGKRVLAPAQDILEVKNALKVYERLREFNSLSMSDLLRAHGVLMNQLVPNAGKFREKGVGIFEGERVAHMAPPAKRVPALMEDLFGFIESKNGLSWLLKSCIFHYEFEFIHPFVDGNGRMGRLWQQLLLMKEHPVFEFVSVEEIIRKHQKDYYDSLAASDRAADASFFVEFSLKTILKALRFYGSQSSFQRDTPNSRLELARFHFKNKGFKRKEYLEFHKDISTATGSRDLAFGIEQGFLESSGNGNQMSYKFTS